VPSTVSPDPERGRISAALIALVVERGYDAVTLEPLLERAGVDRVAFESRFADVRDCFDQVWDEMSASFVVEIREAFARDDQWREKMRRAAYYTLRYFTEDMVRASFFLVGTLSGGDVATARRDRLVALAVEFVVVGRQDLADPELVSVADAEGIAGGIYAALTAAVRKGEFAELGELVPQLMYLAVLPFHGVEAAQEELGRGPADLERFRRGEL